MFISDACIHGVIMNVIYNLCSTTIPCIPSTGQHFHGEDLTVPEYRKKIHERNVIHQLGLFKNRNIVTVRVD